MLSSRFLAILLVICGTCYALDNGLARTPPMGWLAWERFRCNMDCKNDPENCISEHLFKVMADKMVEGGYLDAGYEYLIMDDCWLANERDEEGRLQADAERFPSGIKGLADYVHSKGLKFGIYEDYGTKTCAGYPGSLDHLEIDAQTFADWEVDYVKFDGCNSDPKTMDQGYPDFGKYLNATGRPMVYSCEWPLYQSGAGIKPNYELMVPVCNLWRNYGDVQDSWNSVSDIINYFAENQDEFAQYAGPGHWNDPDMLTIGNFGLSYDQSKSQMGIWAILAAPLLMSVDLRTIKQQDADLLKNPEVLAISQDPLGIQGRRVVNDEYVETWTRPITPVVDDKQSFAVALTNRRTDGTPRKVTFTLKDIGLDAEQGYKVKDVFEGKEYGEFKADDTFTEEVNPTGIVLLRFELNNPSKSLEPTRHAAIAALKSSARGMSA